MFRVGIVCAILAVIHLPILPTERPEPEILEVGEVTTRVRFDFADGGFSDVDRRLVLNPMHKADGSLKQVARGEGWAVQFPAICRDAPKSCPRGILESDPAPWLNPDKRPFRWGASVRLEPDMTSDGSNILQKGLSAVGTQYKLQIDGRAGQPSCVISGPIQGVNRIFAVTSPAGIADSQWHVLRCQREPAALSLVVDGGEVARTSVPPDLSVVNELPLRLGGKGVGPLNDQFHGALDDVFVEIG